MVACLIANKVSKKEHIIRCTLNDKQHENKRHGNQLKYKKLKMVIFTTLERKQLIPTGYTTIRRNRFGADLLTATLFDTDPSHRRSVSHRPVSM